MHFHHHQLKARPELTRFSFLGAWLSASPALLMPIAPTRIQEFREMLGVIQDARPDAKETDAPRFPDTNEGYAGDAQTLGRFFLGKLIGVTLCCGYLRFLLD